MRGRRAVTVGGVAILLCAVCAGPALAALPRTYRVQTIDRPVPAAGGGFGLGVVNAGDTNRDGRADLLVGGDPAANAAGIVFVISGADGSTLRSIPAPDPGGTSSAARFGSSVGTLPDIGSCPGGAPAATCPAAAIGPRDGVTDELVGAVGVDVGGLVDAGRVYVVDGATGAILKRLDMPAADRSDQGAAPGGAARPAFGRAVLSPASPYGRTQSNLSGPEAAAPSVQIGDMNGGGQPDVIVGAPDFAETGATAHPDSRCAAAPANRCLQAGRAYVFYGETIAGTSPAAVESTPDVTIRNVTAQPDDLAAPVNANPESLGLSLAPIGDVGRCTANPGAGSACVAAASSEVFDDRPDVVISSPRTDDFGMADAGVALLLDGATSAVLSEYRHPEPQPASLFSFANYNQPAAGDLGGVRTPDAYAAAMRQNNPFTGGGRGYVMNGAFKQSAGPNTISFATFTDPSPHPSENFGTASAGIGNVAGAEGGLDGRTELLIGAYGPDNPAITRSVVNDVHIFSALTERPLQTLGAPDQQPGAGFGTAVAPMGDLNGDGFLDYAVGAGRYDAGINDDQGRIYLFRSDNSPEPAAPSPPGAAPPPAAPAGPPAAPAPASPRGPVGTPARVLAGRTLTLVASRSRVRRRARVRLRGVLDAFANPAGCERRQRVRIERRAPRRARYRRARGTRTNARGAFSVTVRPAATSVYRARVNRTSTCLGAVSPPERVAVRRRGRR